MHYVLCLWQHQPWLIFPPCDRHLVASLVFSPPHHNTALEVAFVFFSGAGLPSYGAVRSLCFPIFKSRLPLAATGARSFHLSTADSCAARLELCPSFFCLAGTRRWRMINHATPGFLGIARFPSNAASPFALHPFTFGHGSGVSRPPRYVWRALRCDRQWYVSRLCSCGGATNERSFNLSLFSVMAASCDCGYSVNQTNATSYALFTDLVETDFLHALDLKAAGWTPQVYNVTQDAARGPHGKMALLENVVPNPLKSKWDWAGDSIHGGDAGLQVYVRSDPVDDMIPMGEVVIQRTDMLLGSFRVAMKVTGTSGTCGAFFWFRNDTQEIDMEFLSKQLNDTSNPVNLVLQSPQSAQAGYDASHTQTYNVYPLPFRPDDGFHEYRFDWLDDRVSFYADGQWLKDMTIDLPNSAGHLVINHWSNGDPMWSAGPPSTDAILTVSYVKAYFNSSDERRQRDFQRRCPEPDADSQCVIPDQTRAPDGQGPDGNATARTFFFSADPDDVDNQTVFSGWPNESRRTDGGAGWGMLVVGLAVAAGLGWFGLV
ncbi:hypothetical protein JOL62DRAFT_580852 [Phyllosticta paracitricarpa]|uniref:GH16 domain-containing protein n=1 Tax=Phyllosticta paracitricarpa TaxID=2016321 RepID=A0ABR1MZY8_9PEZI